MTMIAKKSNASIAEAYVASIAEDAPGSVHARAERDLLERLSIPIGSPLTTQEKSRVSWFLICHGAVKI